MLITAKNARREILDGVTEMTVWRWINDPHLGFPAPIKIQRRNYFDRARLVAWVQARVAAGQTGDGRA